MSNNVINMNKQHGPFYNSPQRLLNSSEETCICNSGSVKRGRVWECNEQPTSPRLSAVSLQHLFQHCLVSHGSARLRLGRIFNPFQQLIGGSASEEFREKWEDERESSQISSLLGRAPSPTETDWPLLNMTARPWRRGAVRDGTRSDDILTPKIDGVRNNIH